MSMSLLIAPAGPFLMMVAHNCSLTCFIASIVSCAEGRQMVRSRSAHTRECLVRLQVVAPALQVGRMGELDVRVLCEEIASRMRLLGGLAAGVPPVGLPVVEVRRDDAAAGGAASSTAPAAGTAVYDVAVQLTQASPLVVAVLRAACASMVEGAVAGGGRKQKRMAETTPIAVRVLGLQVVS